MEQPAFSVSLCVYGKDDPQWFETAVESILNQTVPPSEVVLVVDGPVPGDLNQVIEKYEQHPLFQVCRLPVNQGLGNARRVGLELCSNELVAMMDSDDISLPDRFKKQLRAFQQTDTDIVGGVITEFMDTPDNIVARRLVPQNHEEICRYMKTRCPMNHVTVMARKTAITASGGYLDWYCNEDYYLWLRMYLANMRFTNVPDVLVNVRVGKDMYQRRGGSKYFLSEAKLQKYMLDHKIIGPGTWLVNVGKRFIVQILLPNKLRGWVFKKFARNQV